MRKAIQARRGAEARSISGRDDFRLRGQLGCLLLVILPCLSLHAQSVTNELRLLEFTNVWQSDLQAATPPTNWTTELGWSWYRYRAPFGESNSPAGINTPLLSPATVTYFFRVPFRLPADPADLVDVTLNHLLDDGALFYLNGQEVARWNMPDGPVAPSTVALTNVTSASVISLSLPPSFFVPGQNMLAVGLHQAAEPQTTARFALELIARARGPRSLAMTTEPQDITVKPGEPLSLQAGVEGSWPRYQWFKNGQFAPKARAAVLQALRATPVDAGDYQLVATNELNAVTSRVARVTVALPTNGPPSLDRIGSNSALTDGQPGSLISEDTRPGGAWGVSASVFTAPEAGVVSNFSLVFFGRNFNAGDTNNATLTTFEDFQLRVKVWTNGVAGWWANPLGGIEFDAGPGPTNPAPFGVTANPLTGEAYPTFRLTVDLSAYGVRVAAGQSVVVAPVFRRDATDKLVRLSLSRQEVQPTSMRVSRVSPIGRPPRIWAWPNMRRRSPLVLALRPNRR